MRGTVTEKVATLLERSGSRVCMTSSFLLFSFCRPSTGCCHPALRRVVCNSLPSVSLEWHFIFKKPEVRQMCKPGGCCADNTRLKLGKDVIFFSCCSYPIMGVLSPVGAIRQECILFCPRQRPKTTGVVASGLCNRRVCDPSSSAINAPEWR